MNELVDEGRIAATMTYRRPWYWLVVVGVMALGTTVLVTLAARSRINSGDEQFAAAQQLRLQHIEQRIDEYFGDSDQMARMGANTFAHIYNDRGLAAWLVRQTFRGRRNQDIYGLGIVYAPYRFESQSKFVCFYERVPDGRPLGRFDSRWNKDIIDVRAFGDEKTGFDYTREVWYQRAVRIKGQLGHSGPYLSGGQSFISTVQAVYKNNPTNPAFDRTSTDPKIGPLFAVVTVDILTSRITGMMHDGLIPGDVVSIKSAFTHQTLIRTGHLPSDWARRDITKSMALHHSGATISIASDASGLRATNRTVVIGAVVVILVIWGLAGVVALGLLQRFRQVEQTHNLEREQARLASEVAIAKTVESELRKTAFTDTLTGCPNRAAFLEHAKTLLGSSDRGSYSVLLADLDRFNVINETLGHSAGDELLRALARRFGSRLPESTFVGRLGGDEFVFVARALGSESERIANMIMSLVHEPVLLFGQTLHMQASIGVVAFDDNYTTPDELLRDADIAVYRAKRNGRSRFEIFDMAMRAEVQRDSELEAELRKALDRGELVPYYQPIIHIETGEIASFEALVRWKTQTGVRTAGEFVAFAEQRGLAYAIDTHIMRSVCAQSEALLALFPGSSIAMNISAAELGSRELPDMIETLLKEFELPALRLRLEITETVMMTQAETANATLERLQDLGIALLLDDFGTGYSSLAYLQKLPIVGLKIDKSFVDHVHEDEGALEIVRSIVGLAEAFGLDTTAEGVENEAQLKVLRDLGVTFAQGFFFSKAVELEALSALRGPGVIHAAEQS